MATVTVTSSKNVTSAIKYAGTGEVVNNYEHLDGQRVLASGGNNVDPNDATFQMRLVQESYGKEKGYLQAYRVIQSFSTYALDPKDESNWDLSNQLGVETAEELYPNHQTVVFTHADSDGGQLHNHIIVNAVALDGASLSTNRSFRAVGKGSNNVLDRHGIDNLGNDYLYEFFDNKNDKETDVERRIKARNDYSWKEDLNNKIEAARQSESVFNTEDFKEHLQERYQIEMYKGKRDYHYEFKDETKKNQTITARKLNKDFREKDLNETFKVRADEIAEQERQESEQVEQVNEDDSDEIATSFDMSYLTDNFGSDIERMRPSEPREPVEQSDAVNEIEERMRQSEEDEEQERVEAEAKAKVIAEQQRQEQVKLDKERKAERLQKIEDDKQEAENKRIVAEQQAPLEEQNKLDRERKEKYDEIVRRVQDGGAVPNKDPVSERKVYAFIEAESYLNEHGKPIANNKRSKDISDYDINRRADFEMADEDKERKQAPELQQQEDEHELE